MRQRLACTIAVLAATVFSAPQAGEAANFIVNANAGFNDNTPASPVGGNEGITVGEQRLIAFEYAASLWGAVLQTDVDIVVDAEFSALSCNAGSAVLGQAGPNFVDRSFNGAVDSNTWYATVIADAITGTNQAPGQADISAEFNANIGTPSCFASRGWYYGLDGNPGDDLDFLTVLLHELGHGLGFLTFVNGQTGEKFNNGDDIYMKFLEDGSLGLGWPDMDNGQRAASAVDGTQSTSDLLWTGTTANTEGAIPGFTVGLDIGQIGGQTQMYAPNPFEIGSSVSHYAKTLSPNELMEPSYTGPIHELTLSVALFEDIGWPEAIDCGDADRSGSIVATDALIALNAAVGLQDCLQVLCDASGDGQVTAVDALTILNAAVGAVSDLRCGLSAG